MYHDEVVTSVPSPDRAINCSNCSSAARMAARGGAGCFAIAIAGTFRPGAGTSNLDMDWPAAGLALVEPL